MAQFDYFVVMAEMRTGSNFLEANLNSIDGVSCHGEAFNPHFLCYPNTTELFGTTQAMRDGDPFKFIETMKAKTDGISGFRYFHDHDPRILEHVLRDPKCGKVILTRNPLESFVSWQIAQATGQWKLTNDKFKKTAKVRFDAGEFSGHLERLQKHQIRILSEMQKAGQTAYYVAYEDLQDVDVMNGIAKWLGINGRLDSLDGKLKKQNPASLEEKVSNFSEMEQALGATDHFALNRTPNFEPRRGAAVPGYVASSGAPLLHMPIPSGPTEQINTWLSSLGDGETGLERQFSQKTLRHWKRKHRGHKSFSVLRHPVRRAHAAFCNLILQTGEGSFKEIRKTLRQVYGLPIPKNMPDADYSVVEHRAAFLAFLEFVKGNLGGQNAIRVDANWATQSQLIKDYSGFASPDLILREESLHDDLAYLSHSCGIDASAFPEIPEETPFSLAEIYDDAVEAAAKSAYQRDYMTFGWGPWGKL